MCRQLQKIFKKPKKKKIKIIFFKKNIKKKGNKISIKIKSILFNFFFISAL